MLTFGLESTVAKSSKPKTISTAATKRERFIYLIYKLGLIENWPVIMVPYE